MFTLTSKQSFLPKQKLLSIADQFGFATPNGFVGVTVKLNGLNSNQKLNWLEDMAIEIGRNEKLFIQ